jgi:hypothetical protein
VSLDPQAVSMQDAVGVAALLDAAAASLLADPARRGSSVMLPRRGRILLTGDLHDSLAHFRIVQELARLGRSPDNHLVLHELIHGERLVNGVDLSYRMLCRVAQLVLAFPGQVHVVLANHELAQAFRHPVSKGAGDNLELFDAGLEWAFGDDAALVEEAIVRFVRAMPLAVRCENGLMLSHSLPAPHELEGFDPGMLDRPLVEGDYALRTGGAWRMTWGRGWDRDELALLGERWNVRTFVLGHAFVEHGAEAPFPNLLLLNSDHEHGRVVAVDLAADAPDADTMVMESVPLSAYGAADA